jgi:nitrite reductase (NADH) small subunit
VDEWVAVAELPVLARRKRMQVDVGGVPVALFVVGQDVCALADTCIHKQRSLSKGVLLNGRVVCPGHQWEFDPATGYEATQDRYQPSYDVRVEGTTVYVASSPRAVTQLVAGGADGAA